MDTISLNEWPAARKDITDSISDLKVMLGELDGAFNSCLPIPERSKAVIEILDRHLVDES